MPVCNYEYNENKMQVRINCLGCLYGSSVEDYPDCMARVIDIILEVKKVTSVILARNREYEYDYPQIKMLTEVAGVIEWVIREKLLSKANISKPDCSRLYPEGIAKLEHIVTDLLRKDPIGAYVELIREIRKLKFRMKSATPAVLSCYRVYVTNTLEVLRKALEKTQIIRKSMRHLAGYHVGDRSLYRQLFMPSVRPNFMLTRYMITPPKGGKSVDRYKVGDTQVEIFKLPDTTQYLYHVLPPEFKLSEEKYSVLDAVRRYMATHRPKTGEFVRSSRVREVFYNIGKDMTVDIAEQMKITLSTKELEQLASILTRYTAGMGVLEILLADEKIQDLFVNSPIERQPILINHADWGECKTNLIPTNEDAEAWATRLRISSGRPLDEANPVLDTDIAVPGGNARFAVITKGLSPHGLGFAIRRHRDMPWTLPLFIKNRMLNPLAAGLLSFLIDGTVSMLVAGGRGSGKTSMLGAIMLEILPQVRIVSIEDTLELPIEHMRKLDYNVERLKSRSVITRVETEMPADEALRTALRLGDSALILGEVRSTEAKALYEAMRIGALSNVVAGTIHGESAYGVYDRVVNDLGVPPTSFKATDIIPICKSLRSADGLQRFRRMTEITEVRKEWDEHPAKEGGFINLMEYSSKKDELKPTDTLLNGESEVLNRIASYVKEWSGNWDTVWENIKLRARIKEAMVNMARDMKRPEILESKWVVASNAKYHLLTEAIRKEIGYSDPERIFSKWEAWFKRVAGKAA
jgi:type IV secretory pathway ATPase VirB11/archaellum biosynthesis ATPase